MYSKWSFWLCIVGISLFSSQIFLGYYKVGMIGGIIIYIIGFIAGIVAFAHDEKRKLKYFSVTSFVLIPVVYYFFFLLWAYQIGDK